jgi:anti-sigma28 factor (negative regulator of flagellin synthesis)
MYGKADTRAMKKKPGRSRRANKNRKKRIARLKEEIQAGVYSVDNRSLVNSLFFTRRF